MPKRRISRFSVENLLSHSTKKLCRGTLLCFTKFLVSKKFMDKRGGGGSITIFCQQCATNFGYRKDFMLQRVMSRFCVEIFLSHSAENFRRGTLLICVSENVRWRKSLWMREGGSIKIFRRKFFVSQCRKNS